MFFQPKAYFGRRRRKKRPVVKILLSFSIILSAACVLYGSASIDDVLGVIAEPAAINLMNDTVNAAYTRFVENAGIEYNDLVTINRSRDGTITALTTNAELLNVMCIQINDSVSAELNKSNVKIKVPLGTLTDIDILAEKGPRYSLSLSQSNTVDTFTKSSFREAGVNQTEHEILFFVTSSMTVLLPGRTGRTATYEYEQSFIVAQSLIVGKVPSVYTDSSE